MLQTSPEDSGHKHSTGTAGALTAVAGLPPETSGVKTGVDRPLQRL